MNVMLTAYLTGLGVGFVAGLCAGFKLWRQTYVQGRIERWKRD